MTAAVENDDAILVARCIAGEAAAWAALVRRYQRLVYGISMRIGLDEHAAADVLQTVFSRLLAHLTRLSQPARLHAWIVTSTKREALRARALGQRTVSLTLPDRGDDGAAEHDVADHAALTDDALSDMQQLDHLQRGLECLDPRCRELLLALFADAEAGVGYDTIARRLGMPVGSLGPTRARCLGKLRKLLEAAEKKS